MTRPKGGAGQQQLHRSADRSSQADACKAKGNVAFKGFKLDDAIELYSKAVSHVPSNPVYISNRSAALYEAGRYAESLADIEIALSHSPEPALAIKLVLRAARCAMWLGQYDDAQAWLQHSAVQGDSCQQQMSPLRGQLRACAQRGASAPQALAALADGTDEDAPPLLRDGIINKLQAMFPSGHDSPHSLLRGALQLPSLSDPMHLVQCYDRAL